ncbi:MAG TPA: hypothetical protein VLG37_04300 [Candidatus Saccharimonadales bacterium]|nr:hypothetical protein [Candidatus Saccharimonadales bacterium]
MSYRLEPAAKYVSPEYWDGVDINQTELFIPGEVAVGNIWLTQKEGTRAAQYLAEYLGEIASGEHAELAAFRRGEFNPADNGLGEGSVVIVDNEYLSHWHYLDPERTMSGNNHYHTNRPITEPFMDYWLRNQMGGERLHFGDEEAVYPEQNMVYSRYLNWGVVIELKDGSYAFTRDAFGAPKLQPGGTVSVPPKNSWIFRGASILPVEVGKARASGRLELDTCAIDTIERIRSLRVVRAGSREREVDKNLAKLLRERAKALGGLGLPNPEPVRS